MNTRLAFIWGTSLCALTVAAGAFGAHGLKQLLSSEQLAVFETAVRYQGMHALGLIIAAWAIERWPGRLPVFASWFFLAGIVLFCGSLYVIALSGLRAAGIITPFGGLAFIAGWLCLAGAAARSRPKPTL